MKKILLILTIFAGFMAWQSCAYDWIDEEPADPNDTIPDTISFSAEIIPLFEKGCNAGVCHGTGGVAPDLTRENAYTSLFDNNQIDIAVPENSILYVKMAPGGSMNKYTSPKDPDKVLEWIQQGALDN